VTTTLETATLEMGTGVNDSFITAIGAGGMPIILSPVTSWGWRTIVLAVMMGIAWVGLPTPCRGHHHSIPAPVISKTVLVHIPMCLGTNSMVLSTKFKVLKHTHKVKAH
jgi:hypothetical protein